MYYSYTSNIKKHKDDLNSQNQHQAKLIKVNWLKGSAAVAAVLSEKVSRHVTQ